MVTKEEVEKYIKGKVSFNFIKCTIPEEKQLELALHGAKIAQAFFNRTCWYHQALIIGAILSPLYNKIAICAPTRSGKSWCVSMPVTLCGYLGKEVYIGAESDKKTDIIMEKAITMLQDAHPDIRNSLVGKVEDKIDKLSQSVSKRKIIFKYSKKTGKSGKIEPLSYNESKTSSSTSAVTGHGGDLIINDESANISDEKWEVGTHGFFESDDFTLVDISNPHKPYGHFRKSIEKDPDTTVIWFNHEMLLEEGYLTKKRLREINYEPGTEGWKKMVECRFPTDNSGSGLFLSDLNIYDPEDDHNIVERYMGVDSAYKGSDDIVASIIGITSTGEVIIENCVSVKPKTWVDGRTEKEIVTRIFELAKSKKVRMICVDTGEGKHLLQYFSTFQVSYKIPYEPINFARSPIKSRYKKSDLIPANRRVEMYKDFKEVVDMGKVYCNKTSFYEVIGQMNVLKAFDYVGSRIKMEDKKKIRQALGGGKSPDELDSIVLALHAFIMWKLEEKKQKRLKRFFIS